MIEPAANTSGKLTAHTTSPSVFITGGWDDFLNTKSNSVQSSSARAYAGRRRHRPPASAASAARRRSRGAWRARPPSSPANLRRQSSKWLGRCPEVRAVELHVEGGRAEPPRPAASAARRTAFRSPRPPGTARRIHLDRSPGLDRVNPEANPVVLLRGEPGVGKSTPSCRPARGPRSRRAASTFCMRARAGEDPRGTAGHPRGVTLVLAGTDVRAFSRRRRRARSGHRLHQAVRRRISPTPGTVSQVRAAGELTRTPSIRVWILVSATSRRTARSPDRSRSSTSWTRSSRSRRPQLGEASLRVTKDRFGPVDEIAPEDDGRRDCRAAGRLGLLAERRAGLPGSAVTAAREPRAPCSSRSEALVGPVAAGSPRRVAIGVDGGRLAPCSPCSGARARASLAPGLRLVHEASRYPSRRRTSPSSARPLLGPRDAAARRERLLQRDRVARRGTPRPVGGVAPQGNVGPGIPRRVPAIRKRRRCGGVPRSRDSSRRPRGRARQQSEEVKRNFRF